MVRCQTLITFAAVKIAIKLFDGAKVAIFFKLAFRKTWKHSFKIQPKSWNFTSKSSPAQGTSQSTTASLSMDFHAQLNDACSAPWLYCYYSVAPFTNSLNYDPIFYSQINSQKFSLSRSNASQWLPSSLRASKVLRVKKKKSRH